MKDAMVHQMAAFSYRQEVYRKLLHLSSLWIPAAIAFLDRHHALTLIGIAFGLSLAFEVLRRQRHAISILLLRLFAPIIRERECRAWFCLTGSTTMLAASLLVCLCFSTPIAVLSLCIMLVGDTVAALIGRRYGRRRILDKSLEGSGAFFASALVAVIAVSSLAGFGHRILIGGLAAVAIATAVELVSGILHLDDNLSVTLSAASTMFLIIHYI